MAAGNPKVLSKPQVLEAEGATNSRRHLISALRKHGTTVVVWSGLDGSCLSGLRSVLSHFRCVSCPYRSCPANGRTFDRIPLAADLVIAAWE